MKVFYMKFLLWDYLTEFCLFMAESKQQVEFVCIQWCYWLSRSSRNNDNHAWSRQYSSSENDSCQSRHIRKGSPNHERIDCRVNFFLIICLLPELAPVSGPLTQWCASTLGTALLCSSRAGSDSGLISRLVWGLYQFGSSSLVGTRCGPGLG